MRAQAIMLSLCLLAVQASIAQQPAPAAVALASIPVHEEIPVPEKPHYFGSGQAFAGIFGLLGGLAVAGQVNDMKDLIKSQMDKKGIDIRQLVAAQLRDQRASRAVQVRPPSAARFRLSILSYGITHKSPFSDDYKPWLRLQLQLADGTGASVWEKTSFINNLTAETPGYRLERYFTDADTMRNSLDTAARIAVHDLLDQFVAQYARKAPD